MRPALQSIVGLGALLALCVWTGCGGTSGPDLGRVSGTVTLGGNPLPDALVTFDPEGEGSPSTATTDASGRYELMYTADRKGAIVGKHKVTVSTFRQQSNPDGTTTMIPEKVPAEYTSVSTTSLVKEVKAGSQSIPIDL